MYTVYRLEVVDYNRTIGHGPYNGCIDFCPSDMEVLDRMMEDHTPGSGRSDMVRPNLYDDFVAFKLGDHHVWNNGVFGCPTLDILYDWFVGYLDDLLGMGFSIVEYLVYDRIVGHSGNQVIFEERYVVSSKILTSF